VTTDLISTSSIVSTAIITGRAQSTTSAKTAIGVFMDHIARSKTRTHAPSLKPSLLIAITGGSVVAIAKMPPIHPAANLFPMLPDAELQALADDIKANGLQQPVVMFGAQLLDGRNRWRACEIAGVEPRLRDWTGDDPIAYVVSLNLKRRHMDESQRAMVAARIATMREGRQKSTTEISVVSQAKASDLLKVSPDSIQFARKVLSKGAPRLAEAVERGEIAVSTAATIAEMPREDQGEILRKLDTGEARNAKEAIRQLGRAEKRVVTLEESLGGDRFQVIYADPPWQYSNTGFDGSAEGQYPTMPTEDICAMPVGDHATSNAVLLMWATWPLLEDALRVIEAWGFEYKTGAPWKKNVHVGGFYFLGITEMLLVGIRGSCTPEKAPIGFFDYPRTKHSKKPEEFYGLIESMYQGPYLEMFARQTRQGWVSFGNEIAVNKGEAA
jgi:N6-adenosine-specific RNA methylase IME4